MARWIHRQPNIHNVHVYVRHIKSDHWIRCDWLYRSHCCISFHIVRSLYTHTFGCTIEIVSGTRIHRVVAFCFVLQSIEWMRSNIIYFVASCAQLWKKLRNWSVRKKSSSASKFTTQIHRTEFTMEQIIANLLVADNAVIQKVSFILRTK